MAIKTIEYKVLDSFSPTNETLNTQSFSLDVADKAKYVVHRAVKTAKAINVKLTRTCDCRNWRRRYGSCNRGFYVKSKKEFLFGHVGKTGFVTLVTKYRDRGERRTEYKGSSKYAAWISTRRTGLRKRSCSGRACPRLSPGWSLSYTTRPKQRVGASPRSKDKQQRCLRTVLGAARVF